jgi:biopolymer transport protein ExbB
MKRLVACFALLAASPLALLAQDDALNVPTTLLQKLNMPTIYILLVCSMFIVWLTVDGYLRTGRKTLLPAQDVEQLKTYFRAGDYHGAYAYSRANPGALTNTVGNALRSAPEGKQAVEDSVVASIVGSQGAFNSKIAYLSVIGVIAPMIGLTGTVFGMIDAFAAMGASGAADPSRLSAAIGAVLYATAGGLVVAIPAFVFYYLLRNRVAHVFHELHVVVADLFRQFPYDHLREANFEGAEIYAAAPNWVTGVPPVGAETAQTEGQA